MLERKLELPEIFTDSYCPRSTFNQEMNSQSGSPENCGREKPFESDGKVKFLDKSNKDQNSM